MPRPFLIVSQSDYLIQIVDFNSHTYWQTVQIQISWLLQKPSDLDLYCLQMQGISGFSRTRVKCNKKVFRVSSATKIVTGNYRHIFHAKALKKYNVLFLISSPICHRVGRLATFFFSLLFFPRQITIGEL